jgi:hypothetical protein
MAGEISCLDFARGCASESGLGSSIALLQALEPLTPENHTVGIAFLLSQKLVREIVNIQLFLRQVADLFRRANAQQVPFVAQECTRRASATASLAQTRIHALAVVAVGRLCHEYGRLLPTVDGGFAAAMAPLRSAIALLQAGNAHKLTPAHAEFLKACIKTKCYADGAALLETSILDVSKDTGLLPQDVLLHFYYGVRVLPNSAVCHRLSRLLFALSLHPRVLPALRTGQMRLLPSVCAAGGSPVFPCRAAHRGRAALMGPLGAGHRLPGHEALPRRAARVRHGESRAAALAARRAAASCLTQSAPEQVLTVPTKAQTAVHVQAIKKYLLAAMLVPGEASCRISARACHCRRSHLARGAATAARRPRSTSPSTLLGPLRAAPPTARSTASSREPSRRAPPPLTRSCSSTARFS